MPGNVLRQVDSVWPQASASRAKNSVRVWDGLDRLAGATYLYFFLYFGPGTKLAMPKQGSRLLDGKAGVMQTPDLGVPARSYAS